MLQQADLERAVEMQQRSYFLLRWMAKAVSDGFVSFSTAHAYSSLPEAAEAWILGHYANIPEKARPQRGDLATFCAFFSTYLTNSFDFVSNPGQRLYAPVGHCFCPFCSWLLQAPHLQAKKLLSGDKRRAQTMRSNAIQNLAAEHRIEVREDEIERILNERHSFEQASLLAYGHDLLEREQGIANGPAVLALWRGFAWNELGSPKHRFRLTAKLILDAERQLLVMLQEI